MEHQNVLIQQVMLFNQGVRSGDFSAMLEHFTDDAEQIFIGTADGPFRGKSNIAAAYQANPPTQELKLLAATEQDGRIIADFAWRSSPYEYAGKLIIDCEGEKITRLVVMYES